MAARMKKTRAICDGRRANSRIEVYMAEPDYENVRRLAVKRGRSHTLRYLIGDAAVFTFTANGLSRRRRIGRLTNGSRRALLRPTIF